MLVVDSYTKMHPHLFTPPLYWVATTNIRIITTAPMMLAIIATNGMDIVFLLSPFASNVTNLYMAGYDFTARKGMTNMAISAKTKHTSRQ